MIFDIIFPNENFIISRSEFKTKTQNLNDMKNFLTAVICLAISFAAIAQPCTPNAPTGNPGVFPDPDNIPCIERDMFYDVTLQTENFDTISLAVPFLGTVAAAVNWLRIDSIVNFPCGITWESDTLQYGPNETGCIRVSGTSLEPVGQYPIGIYVTLEVNLPQLGIQEISGELNDLASQGGVATDYFYVSRVVNQGDPCPARDLNASGVAASGTCPSLQVEITGTTVFCGGSETLTAEPGYELGIVSYLWSPGGETTPSISVSTDDTYSVTVTDQNGTATASVTVSANEFPTAGFTASVSGLSATFTNTSDLATDYSWDFGDGNNSIATDPSHTYTTDGNYDVTLIATNACGSDTTTESITVATPPCIANAPSGTPGISPAPDNIPCVERNSPYDFTMQVENFDSFTLNTALGTFDVPITITQIDSIGNLPCGFTWAASQLVYAPGETGCIRVSGTSREIVGQYPLLIYMTMTLDVPFLGPQTISGELNTELIPQLEGLAGPLGFDFKYVSRVINAGDNCPARDTTSEETASGAICPPLGVDIEGNPTICSGQPTTLTAVAQYETGTVSYLWSDNSTSATFTATTAGTYSVTITDDIDTATKSVTVSTGTPPTAGFTAVVSTPAVTVNNTSTGAGTYLWNFGEPASGSNNTSTLASPAHTYLDNGSYTISLTVTNNCGTATDTETVTITGVGIASVQYDLTFEMFPNPSNGTVALQFSAENSKDVYELNIFDLSGKNVHRERITSVAGTVQRQLDLSALAKGVYTLRLDSEKGFGVKKLILN